jgi:hypothetical protein
MRAHLLYLSSLLFLGYVSAVEQVIINSPQPMTPYQPSLADLLTIESSTSIFYSYARETELSERFGNDEVMSTLLVPTNKAVMALARKP